MTLMSHTLDNMYVYASLIYSVNVQILKDRENWWKNSEYIRISNPGNETSLTCIYSLRLTKISTRYITGVISGPKSFEELLEEQLRAEEERVKRHDNHSLVFVINTRADYHAKLWPSGPSCSKLTTSLVNGSLKFTSSDTQICWNFLPKKCE